MTFGDLSPEAQKDLSEYVRQGELVITASASWDPETRAAQVLQYGERRVMPQLVPFFDAVKAKALVGELRTKYADIRKEVPDLPDAGASPSKPSMIELLRTYEEAHPELCELERSGDQFYGFTKGANRLGKHVQWVFVPAVKDAVSEQDESKETALGRLLLRTVRSKVDFDPLIKSLRDTFETEYKKLLDGHQGVLANLSGSLGERLRDWAHADATVDLKWHYDDRKTIVVNSPSARALMGEGSFVSEVARLGHGMQRSFIVAVLQELAGSAGDASPTLILGFEEPELYQHPPQARHLSSVLRRLSGSGSQVVVATHSPYFVRSQQFNQIRRATCGGIPRRTDIHSYSHAELAEDLAAAHQAPARSPSSVMASIEQILQPSQAEMFFARVPVFVEGVVDVAFLATVLQLSGKWDDFRRLGCHFVVAEGKGKMTSLAAIASGLKMRFFAVFDGDASKGGEKHHAENESLLRICGHSGAPAVPAETYWLDGCVVWQEDIETAIKDDVGEEVWNSAEQAARDEFDLHGGVRGKNSLLVTATIERLWAAGTQISVLDELCRRLIAWADEKT